MMKTADKTTDQLVQEGQPLVYSLAATIHRKIPVRVDLDDLIAYGEVGLAEAARTPFGHYSMGMRQRLGLAAAFLHHPGLAILDEPTNGLDPVGQRQIRSLIAQLAQGEGAAVLLCSHLLDEVSELCSRALVIEQGRMILDSSLAEPVGIEAVRGCFDALAAGHAPQGDAS